MSRFAIQDLRCPVIAAPMAAGPSTPKLAAAVTNAGGLGFLAGGLVSAQTLADSLSEARQRTSGPIGINLFVPQPVDNNIAEIQSYAAALAPEAERYGVVLGEPRYHDDDWAAKLDVVYAMKPDLVSFTFGLPGADLLARIRAAGITSAVTVTSLDEAQRASARDVDALIVQGPQAGGHSATFDPVAPPPNQPLEDLLAAVTRLCDVPRDRRRRPRHRARSRPCASGWRGRGAIRHRIPARRRGGNKSRSPRRFDRCSFHTDRRHSRFHRTICARAAQSVHRRTRCAGGGRISQRGLPDWSCACRRGQERRPARNQPVGRHRLQTGVC